MFPDRKSIVLLHYFLSQIEHVAEIHRKASNTTTSTWLLPALQLPLLTNHNTHLGFFSETSKMILTILFYWRLRIFYTKTETKIRQHHSDIINFKPKSWNNKDFTHYVTKIHSRLPYTDKTLYNNNVFSLTLHLICAL